MSVDTLNQIMYQALCSRTVVVCYVFVLQRKARYDSAEYNLLQEGKQPKDGIVLVSLQMTATPLKARLTEPTSSMATGNRPSRLSRSSTAEL
jgi:hypothetical protein